MVRKYRYLLLTWSLSLLSLSLFAQRSEGGLPPSFDYPSTLRAVSLSQSIDPQLDVKRLIWEDSIAERNGNALRVAIEVPVNIDMKTAGQWRTLPDSTHIWQHTVSLKDASGVIISYDDFYIPKGGKLFIYNKEQTEILGAYTNETHPQGGRFATEPLSGSTFTLEYVASDKSKEEPRIAIRGLGYMYKGSTCTESGCLPKINESSSRVCTPNVNCEEGNSWKNQKKGVVMFFARNIKDDNKLGPIPVWSVCTGSLINNTKEDEKPYILTAKHCFHKSDFDQLIVYFNHEFSGCNNEDVMPDSKSLVGAIPRVNILLKGGSDTYLFELKDAVPKTWKPYYNGWDRRNNPAKSGAVIHHPYFDVKKITLYSKPVTATTWNDNEGAKNAHWKVVYSKGVTEGGSSGSPIFNENGWIVGTLSGGSSTCSNTSAPDLYGKLWYAWDQSPSYNDEALYDQQLQPYLDPLNKGVEFLKGYDPNNPSGIEDEFENDTKRELILFPIPAVNELNVNTESIIRKMEIFDMGGRLVVSRSDYSGSTATLDISALASGVYTIKVKTDQKELIEKFLKK